MSKKTSKIIAQKAKPKKGKTSGSAIVGISLCVLVLAALGFAIAEQQGLTNTRFLFKGEVIIRGKEHLATPDRIDDGTPAKNKSKKKVATAEKDAKADPEKVAEIIARNDKAKATDKSKNNTIKKAKKPVEPLPLAAFTFIAQRPQSWPAFIRMTRSRTIAVVDPQTGVSMGYMDVPAGTIVKIRKVNTNGSIQVFDRTGQIFQVEASGTNFSAAFAAAKNKPKKKPTKKKVVVAASQPEKAQPPVAAGKPSTVVAKKKSGSPVMTAFGTTIEDGEWDEAEAEAAEEDY